MIMKKEYGSSFELSTQKGNNVRLNDGKNIIFLRTAREALLLLAISYKKMAENCVVLPALCCSSMVQPFLQMGYKIKYYRLNDDLTINFDSLYNEISFNSIVIVMHYYGHRAYTKKEIEELKINNPGITLIQDCTQNLYDKDLYDEFIDYYVGSIRKWVAIADGAFLYANKIPLMLSNIDIEDDEKMAEIVYSAMSEKKEYLSNGNEDIKRIYREKFAFVMQQLKQELFIHNMSKLSKNIYCNNINEKEVIDRRKRNYKELLKNLKRYENIIKYLDYKGTPFCFVICVKNRDILQEKLAQKGVYCQVLWPIPEEAKKICKNSKNFSDHMLAIPCDQRYDEDDMRNISNILIGIIEGELNENIDDERLFLS